MFKLKVKKTLAEDLCLLNKHEKYQGAVPSSMVKLLENLNRQVVAYNIGDPVSEV